MSLQSLEDLFVDELHDLHDAERQLVTALPKMADAAASYRLRQSFEGQVVQARHRLKGLEPILQELGKAPRDAAYVDLEGSVDVLIWGEWVPVESSRSARRPRCAPTDAVAPVATCHAMEGLIEQGRKLIDEDVEPHVKDAGLVAVAQHMQHYEIAGYGATGTLARLLGHTSAEQFLQQMLRETEQTNESLTELVESELNAEALQVG